MMFTLNRDRVVPTMAGRSIEFKKNVPTHVPPQCHAEVIAACAIPESEIEEPKGLLPVAPAGTERLNAIKAALQAVAARGQREDFTASGAPHLGVLAGILGFAIDQRERDAVWTEMLNAEVGDTVHE